jgi:putative addiction module killer protein
VIEIRQTVVFADWLDGLRDAMAVKRIKQRLARVQIGLFGDAKSVGEGVSELRVDHGPGYRVYFSRRGDVVVILLCGGDKGSQRRDIVRAKDINKEVEN